MSSFGTLRPLFIREIYFSSFCWLQVALNNIEASIENLQKLTSTIKVLFTFFLFFVPCKHFFTLVD